MELVYVGAAVGAAALAGGAVWAAVRYARAPPAPASEEPVKLEVVADDDAFAFTPPAPAPRPAPAAAAPPPRAPAPAPAAPPPRSPTAPRSGFAPPRPHPERAPAMVLTQGVALHDAGPARPRAAPPAPPRPPMRDPPPMKSWAQQVKENAAPEVPTEWARRQVGPVEPGRKAGACGGCGARLSVSDQRPLRIACPVCGRTKLVA